MILWEEFTNQMYWWKDKSKILEENMFQYSFKNGSEQPHHLQRK